MVGREVGGWTAGAQTVFRGRVEVKVTDASLSLPLLATPLTLSILPPAKAASVPLGSKELDSGVLSGLMRVHQILAEQL